MFSAMWHNFYNSVVRDVTPAIKGGIIFGLAILGLICVLFALLPSKKHKEKSDFVQNWFLLFLGFFFIILDIIYVCL